MSEETKSLREDLMQIKTALACGWISYDEAKIEAEPLLERLNDKAKEVAKKYKRNFYPFTFTEIMR